MKILIREYTDSVLGLLCSDLPIILKYPFLVLLRGLKKSKTVPHYLHPPQEKIIE